MRSFFLSMSALFLSIAAVNAQEIHLPGLPDPCSTDLVFGDIGNLPATAYSGDVISFAVEIKNTNEECIISQSNLRVQLEIGSFIYDYVDVTVPNFYYQNSHIVEVNYTVPPQSSGAHIFVTSMTLDSNNSVSETNENNNVVLSTPLLPVVIQ